VLKISLLSSLVATSAAAHGYWANARRVPEWVKDPCCSAVDIHHLTPGQVHRVSDDFYRIDGYPAPDSNRQGAAESGRRLLDLLRRPPDLRRVLFDRVPSDVYCFFVPLEL